MPPPQTAPSYTAPPIPDRPGSVRSRPAIPKRPGSSNKPALPQRPR